MGVRSFDYLKAVPRSVLREWSLLTAALAIGAGVLTYFSVFARADTWWYDTIVASGALPVPTDVMIVNIEGDTLDRRDASRRNWTKSDTAELLDAFQASAPKAVYLDDPLHTVDAMDTPGERKLSDAIRRSGRVVLPIYLQTQRAHISGFRLPTPAYANFSAALSQARITYFDDGIARSLPMTITNGDIEWLHVSAVLAQLAQGSTPLHLPAATRAPVAQNGWRDDRILYLRGLPEGASFANVTARQVLNGEIGAEQFANKIVFVGLGGTDRALAVPGAWGAAQFVSRLELFAHALNTLRTQSWPSKVGRFPAALLAGFLVLVMLLAFLLLTDRQAWIASVLFILGFALLAWAALARAGIWFPLAGTVAICMLAYPFWAWRRLSAMHRYVSQELQRMRSEPAIVGDPRATPDARGGRLIDQQLAAIEGASAKLRAGRQFIADVIESMPIAIAVVGMHGRVTLCNSEAVMLLSAAAPHRESVLGADLLALIHARCANKPAAELLATPGGAALKLMEGGRVIRQAQEVVLGDAGTFWMVSEPVQRSVARDSDNAEETVGIVAFTNITSLKLAQQHREELLHFVSHDMRSPLASILAVIELRKEAMTATTEDARFAEISSYARHTIALADEFLRIVYASAMSEVEFTAVDLGGAIDAALELVRPQALERGVSIHWAGLHTITVQGSHNLLVRMFANLLGNAVKFSKKGTTVLIELSAASQQCSVTIDNEGGEFPLALEDSEQWFKPYSSMKRHTGGIMDKGIGLGLAFVKVVVSKHNGSVALQALAAGMRALVQLPLAPGVTTPTIEI